VQRHQLLEYLYLDVQDLDAAEQVAHSMPTPSLMVPLLLAKGQWSEAGHQALHELALGETTPVEEPYAVNALRQYARATGQFKQAINILAERSQTERDAAGNPIVRDPSGIYVNVVGLADMLIQSGQADAGRRLLEAVLAAMDRDATILGKGTLWPQEMRNVALALLGRNDEAVAGLRTEVVIQHSLTNWWYCLQQEPAYGKLRADPRFQDILRVARAHAGSERQRLDQLRSSHLVPDRGRRPISEVTGH
jgi:hypothetical protein